MFKGLDLKNLISGWEKDGTFEEKSKTLIKIPKECIECNCRNIDYWTVTEEEIVFQCRKCRRYYSFPFDQDKLRFYFAF